MSTPSFRRLLRAHSAKSRVSTARATSLDHADTLAVAIHTVTGHRVAMKFISKQVINATKTRTRVQREVEYMRTLRHAHIIKL